MKEEIKVLELDRYEFGILINALNEFRNKLIKENKDTEPIDEILLRVIDAPSKKILVKSMRSRDDNRI